jgi:hypothetical protein
MTNDPPYISRFTFNFSPRLVALLLFLITLAPRLPGLNRFLTSDEKTNIFIAGSDVIAAFLRGDLRGTYWHFYPGVTMSWLDALGMGGQYLLDTVFGAALPPFSEYIYGDILSLVAANRLPYAILTAAAVPAMYLLARKLLPERVALLGTLFMAFDPFYLAHSRVAHGDAPVAVFMSLSALTFFLYAQRVMNRDVDKNLAQTRARTQQFGFLEPPVTDPPPANLARITAYALRSLTQTLTDSYLIASAIFGSLAALTKAPGQFMALFIMGMSFLYAISQIRHAHSRQSGLTPYVSNIISHWLTVIIAWGLISFIVFTLLWPSMWVDPVGTFRQMWAETFGKVNEGHLVYFFGQATLNPGPWFYLYVIPFRMTPIILLGSLFSISLFIPKFKSFTLSRSPKRSPNPVSAGHPQFRTIHQTFSPLFLLWLFAISLLIFGNISPKKQDRYLLPLFPFLNLVAAIGWLGLWSIIDYQISGFKGHFSARKRRLLLNISMLGLLLLHFIPVLTYYPYYLTYFNPLMGGPSRATQTTLMGWGEGMELVAAYLNTKPQAENLYVAATPSQTLLPYFAGTGENFYTNDIAFRADYVVLYLAQMQRLAPSPEIVGYFQAQQPEKIITIKGIPYAKIYPGPRFILPDIPSEATPSNVGLDDTIRLAGYRVLKPQSPERSPNLQISLYWHALTSLPSDYTISVRARTAAGQLLVQQDRWPVNGLLPTSQWRPGDYVVDTHTLEFPAADISQISEFEIVVYNAETGQTLGPPIMIPNEQ